MVPFRDRYVVCPSCGEALVEATMFGGSEVLRCEACPGIFMSHSTVAEFTNTLQEVTITEHIFADATTPMACDGRVCPHCQQNMSVAHVGMVIVDICEDHGVWFDADELSQLSVIPND